MGKIVSRDGAPAEVRIDKGKNVVSIWGRVKDRVGLRMDNWINLLSGIGVPGLDKLNAGDFRRTPRLPDQFLEDLYNGDDIAARIVDIVPEEALREGYELTIEPDEETDDSVAQAKQMASDVERFLEDELKATERIVEAWVWGRLFGAGAIYMVVDDGADTDQAEPLVPERLRKIESLTVLDKRDLIPASVYEDPSHPKFGEIETYRVNTFGPVGNITAQIVNVQIHESRLILFEGSRTTNRERQANEGFAFSVLQRVFDVLKQFNLSWASLANMLQSASQGVFKMHGLIEMIAAGESDTMQRRMSLVDLQRSVARSLLIDADNEKFEQIGVNLSGVPDSLRVFMLRIASAAKMPLTILMGQSPAGLNATGEGDLRVFVQMIASEQQRVLKPRLMWLAQLAMTSSEGPTSGRVPERWEIVFPPLIQMTELEQATIRKTIAEVDKIYIETGVLIPEEVAISRFPMGGFSMNTAIDVRDRQELLEAPDGPEPEPTPVLPPEPTEPGEPAAVTPEAVDPGTALNGAQVKAMQEIIISVADGQLPKTTAIRMIAAAFPVSEADATRILEDVKEPGNGEPPPPPAAPPGAPGAPPPPPSPTGGSAHLEREPEHQSAHPTDQCRPDETDEECRARLLRGDELFGDDGQIHLDQAVVQTLIFSKDRFETAAEARTWIREQNEEGADFRSDKVDEPEDGETFRFRQRDPGRFIRLRTITLTEGVQAVVGPLKGD